MNYEKKKLLHYVISILIGNTDGLFPKSSGYGNINFGKLILRYSHLIM